jgi:hypothetical protein
MKRQQGRGLKFRRGGSAPNRQVECQDRGLAIGTWPKPIVQRERQLIADESDLEHTIGPARR